MITCAFSDYPKNDWNSHILEYIDLHFLHVKLLAKLFWRKDRAALSKSWRPCCYPSTKTLTLVSLVTSLSLQWTGLWPHLKYVVFDVNKKYFYLCSSISLPIDTASVYKNVRFAYIKFYLHIIKWISKTVSIFLTIMFFSVSNNSGHLILRNSGHLILAQQSNGV